MTLLYGWAIWITDWVLRCHSKKWFTFALRTVTHLYFTLIRFVSIYNLKLVEVQLTEQQKKRTAFLGFRETTPSFKPTYKVNFLRVTFNYFVTVWRRDGQLGFKVCLLIFCCLNLLIFSEKRRVPAWCDRVLYWTRDKNVKIEQTSYKSAESVTVNLNLPQFANILFFSSATTSL